MSMVRMIAIEPINGRNRGDDFEVSEREAKALEARRLARVAVPPSNKMKPNPANKVNPSVAAGGARRSSASPAAQASVQTTAQPSAPGARPARKTTLPTPPTDDQAQAAGSLL